jgi:hypothetical protein
MRQIRADDDDLVLEKNPTYYALKTIDDEKLKCLGVIEALSRDEKSCDRMNFSTGKNTLSHYLHLSYLSLPE